MTAPVVMDWPEEIVYPDSDGQPRAENTKQFRWIVTIKENLDAEFAANPEVFVAGDLLWYPVEGKPEIRIAPDVMVVFGRPKGDRGSYQQWKEGNVAPQVVFEIWSPGNRPIESVHKLAFFDRYGVEEFYLYDPDHSELTGFRRLEGKLQEIGTMAGWVSPRLGIRFEMINGELALHWANDGRFLTFLELNKERDEALLRAEQEARRAEQEARRAEQEAQRANSAEAEVVRLRALLESQQKPEG